MTLLSVGEICEFKYGASLPERAREPGNVPVFGSNGAVGRHSEALSNGPAIVIGRKGSIGQINFSRNACWPIDTTYFVDRTATQQDLHWLAYALSSLNLHELNKATGVPSLNRNDAYEKRLFVPPLDEQRRIAAILDQADDLRCKRREAWARIGALSSSIFVEMFGDIDRNNRGWPKKSLSEIVREDTIVTYGIVQAGEEFRGGVPYIRTGDIVDGEIKENQLRRTDPAIAAKFARSRVESNEIVMSIRATVGTTAFVPPLLDGANLTQGTARISPGKLTHRRYLLAYLRSDAAQRWLQRQVKGATFREITLNRLREMPILIPPLDLQRDFAARIVEIEGLVTHHRAHLAKLDALFASLQYRAFRGEL